MCLRDITRIYNNPSDEEVTVYKAFSKNLGGTLDFPYHGGQVKRGEWLTATDKYLSPYGRDGKIQVDIGHERYAVGFHGYVHETSAKNFGLGHIGGTGDFAVLPVKFRKVRTEGVQGGKVLVADEMYVPTEEELNAK